MHALPIPVHASVLKLPRFRGHPKAGVRYADDTGFEHEEDGQQFLDDLRARLRQFALELHDDKTRLIEFGRFANATRLARGERGVAPTFNFSGSSSKKSGRFLLTRHSPQM